MNFTKEWSAYQGGSWSPRTTSHEEEINYNSYWNSFGLNSEWNHLKAVLLYDPPSLLPKIENPEQVQHLGPINWEILKQENQNLVQALVNEGVKVFKLRADSFPHSSPNLMFIRDLFFMTPWGAILGRPASTLRAGEEKWAQWIIAQLGIPILQMIRGRATFEGADALWLNPQQVLLGVGQRTNDEGYHQLKNILQEWQVEVLPIPLPKGIQHLLGITQIISKDKVFIRTQIAPQSLRNIFEKNMINIIEVEESEEIIFRQSFNLINLGENKILMPSHCPKTKDFFSKHSLQVRGEIPFHQHLQAAGGLACATGILSRQI